MKAPRPRKTVRPQAASGPRLSAFARQLLNEWRRLGLSTTDTRILVAVSGGADSTALLLALDELIQRKKLKTRLVVAHLDHGLRGGASREDARWVKSLAKRLGYRATVGKAEVRKLATKSRDNLEQAARRARYSFLARTAKRERADLVLIAHTMDDQAETVLLNLLRGSGADGLGGIEPLRRLEGSSKAQLARPLLAWARRADTEAYCGARAVEFRADPMNADEHFARVRVRQKLLPLMQTFNARIVEALTRTADLLRDDKAALNSAADRLLELAAENGSKNRHAPLSRLQVDLLLMAPMAVRRRALRQWIAKGRGDLRRIELVHILAVEGLLSGDQGGRTIELPGGAKVSRKRGWLQFHE
jgi:tRNA(Ile)-lysidine synthase